MEVDNDFSMYQFRQLLREIVTLWVTVRGFSITAMWMEVYKKVCQTITTKRAGLRKELRQSSK